MMATKQMKVFEVEYQDTGESKPDSRTSSTLSVDKRTEIEQFRRGASSHITAIITNPFLSEVAAFWTLMYVSRF